ncbi:ethylbenzene dehydrogenase-related protein [Neptuniibacter sp. SY11_33]|uniref:ethylbenzene dehydrogenase-related protein n=1 Tax=Neptuniibacter sp. SY11_33 TaxID=3398215 RepID=UPI0039F5CFD5
MKKITLITMAAMFSHGVYAADNTLMAKRIQGAVAIDGLTEEAWNITEPLHVTVDELPYEPNNGYEGIKESDVELRAMYDDEYLYMHVRWNDPTLSLERFPWVKQDDGSWKQLKNLDSTGHGNTYYEDKFAFFWNISEKGFAKKGCDRSCHVAEDGMVDDIKDTSAGRHFTRSPDETIDIWHWKSARSNPVYQVDDQYVNHFRNENKGWGRNSDEKTGGGYKNNINKDKTAPAWMPAKADPLAKYWVMSDNKVPFVDKFEPGAVIGGIVAQAAEGSRGDLQARGEWKDGFWTLEIKRKLVTEHPKSKIQDVQFSDLGKQYLFGVTVFDNAQINHIFHKKALRLNFSK